MSTRIACDEDIALIRRLGHDPDDVIRVEVKPGSIEVTKWLPADELVAAVLVGGHRYLHSLTMVVTHPNDGIIRA